MGERARRRRAAVAATATAAAVLLAGLTPPLVAAVAPTSPATRLPLVTSLVVAVAVAAVAAPAVAALVAASSEPAGSDDTWVDPETGLPTLTVLSKALEARAAKAGSGGPWALALIDVAAPSRTADVGEEPAQPRMADVVETLGPEIDRADALFRTGHAQLAILHEGGDTDFVDALPDLGEELPGVRAYIGVGRNPGESGTDAAAQAWDEAEAALRLARRDDAAEPVPFDAVADQATPVTHHHAEAVRALLSERRVTTLYEPVYRVSDQRVFAFRARPRPDDDYRLAAAKAREAAARLGRLSELDRVLRHAVLDDGPGYDLNEHHDLWLAVSPVAIGGDALTERHLLPAIRQAGLTPARVVLELHRPADASRDALRDDAARLRSRGLTIALNGLGGDGLPVDLLTDVEFDYLVVDAALAAAAAHDERAQHVLRSLGAIAKGLEAKILVPGIDDRRGLALAQTLGTEAHSTRLVHAVCGPAVGRARPRPQLDEDDRGLVPVPGADGGAHPPQAGQGASARST